MTVYLIHFDQPYKGKQHYIGYAHCVESRMVEHKATTWTPLEKFSTSEGKTVCGVKHGNGANFLAVLNHYGIGYEVVRVWDGGRDVERRIKAQKNGRRVCPICNPNYATRMAGNNVNSID